MMVCNCTLGGTAACRNCPRFIEYYGNQTGNYLPLNYYYTWQSPNRDDEIFELLKKINEKLDHVEKK